MPVKYDFYKTKYGKELLIDLINLKDLNKYITSKESHFLTYYDITIIESGDGILYIDDYGCSVNKGSVIFTKPKQIRKWDCSSIPKGFALIFEEEFLCSFFNDTKFIQKLSYFQAISQKPLLKISTEELSFIKNILNNISNEIHYEITNYNHMLRALLYQLIIWFDRKYEKPVQIDTSHFSRYTSKFIELVSINFQTYHLVNFYANKLNITAGYLNDIIKKDLKISAKQFIQNRIILQSKRLLDYSDLSVSEIAWKLNFQDLSYFIRFFKKETGFTPLQFKRKNP